MSAGQVESVLERCRHDGTRIVIDYGDPITGTSWGETHGVRGTVGRSCGRTPVYILLANSRSRGGGMISIGSILSIHESRSGRALYRRQKKIYEVTA